MTSEEDHWCVCIFSRLAFQQYTQAGRMVKNVGYSRATWLCYHTLICITIPTLEAASTVPYKRQHPLKPRKSKLLRIFPSIGSHNLVSVSGFHVGIAYTTRLSIGP